MLVSAAIVPESVPALALEKALLQFEICASDETLDELKTVLLRPKFDRYIRADLRREFVSGLRDGMTIVVVDQIVTDCIDTKDNKFLALAETADAELIVASDPLLTAMHRWREIPILPSSAFLVGIR